MKTEQTQTKDSSRVLRKIIKDNPDPPIEFQETLQGWEPKFPCLMIPWGGGQPIIYSVEDRNTYYKIKPPAWGYYPETTVHLAGEDYRLGMGAIQLALALRSHHNHPNIDGIQIAAGSWLINDIYMPDEDANSRMYQMVNLPPQPDGVLIARPVQVTTKDYLNQYLANFKETGFIGALVRDLKADYFDPQYAVIQELT